MPRFWLAAAMCAALAPAPAEAQSSSFVKSLVADEWRMWTTPVRRETYQARAFERCGLPFALVAGALIATDRKITGQLPNTDSQRIWSGRISQFGSWYGLAGISGGTYLAGRLTGSDRLRETGRLAIAALGHAQAAVFVFKQATNRERPYQDDRKGRFWAGGTAFPSGHATGAFAVATVFAHEYRRHIAVPIAAYSLAAAVSASRVGAQRHWASDVVTGTSLGFLVGRFTYRRNHDPNLTGEVERQPRRAVPQLSAGRSGAALYWHF